jgi:hypothetical protein
MHIYYVTRTTFQFCFSCQIEASHEETKPATMKLDEQQVNDLIDHIRNKMTDPFDVALHPALLINISTGMQFPLDSLIMVFFGCHIAPYGIESSRFLVYCKFA